MDPYLEKELDILLEEYKALRSELVLTMGNTRQVLQLSLIAIGVFLAASPNIVNSGYPVLFLIIPLCLYGLSLTFLRYLFLHIEIIDHIHHVVAPRVRSILKDLCPDTRRELNGVLSWEDESGYSGPLERYDMLYWPIPIGPQFVPLLGAIVSLVAYFLTTKPLTTLSIDTLTNLAIDILTTLSIDTLTTLSIDTALVCANIVGLIYLFYVGFQVGRRSVRTSTIAERSVNTEETE